MRQCGGAPTIDIATGHVWAESIDLVAQIGKKDAVMAKAVITGQRFVQQNPKVCQLPIEIKVLTPFGDATGSLDPIKEQFTMRIPTDKVAFKMVTLSIEGDFWSLGKNGVTVSTGTFTTPTSLLEPKEHKLPIGQ